MNQIGEKLGIPPSVVCYILIKANVKRRSFSDATSNTYTTRFKKPQFKIRNNLSLDQKELRIAGVMLYWGEGSKRNNRVSFANSDPEMIKVFLCFLREICGVSEERLRASLHMYPDHNEEHLIYFWSSVTSIPKSRFWKTFIHVGRKGTYKRKSLYGTLALSYSDKRLLKQILDWIEEYKRKVLPG